MNRPSYKELWSDEYKDRDEQLQWIRNAVNGNAKFRNSEPPYSEEEELARKIMQMHTRIAELEAAQRWIPVSERLPDTKIVYDEFDVIVELVDIGTGEMIRRVDLLSYDYRNNSWNDDCGEFGFYPVTGVTHWRERPAPPEVQE